MAVNQQVQALAYAIALAVRIPDNRQAMAAVRNIIQSEPLPSSFRQERIDFNNIIRPRSQTDKSGNQEVGIGGMMIKRSARISPL